MIRKATHADLQQIVELAAESVARDSLPVSTDREAMMNMGRLMIGNPAHFVWVGEMAGEVTACVAACVQPGFWFRGLQASVILYFARVPGDGIALLREFARWVRSRSGIKIAVIELEPGCDPRIKRALSRIGFPRESANMVYVRRAE